MRTKLIKVYVDASKIDNQCSIGIVMISENNRLLFKRHMKISNYRDTVKLEMSAIEKGVQMGLKRCRKNEKIIIYNDCIDAVEKSKLKCSNVQIEWIPRKCNYADLLSRRCVTDEEFEAYHKQKQGIIN